MNIQKIFLSSILLILSAQLQAQDWQWIKRGGSITSLAGSGSPTRVEETLKIVVDSDQNSYLVSKIGYGNPDVDGNAVPYYGEASSLENNVITSFTCDGTYRWSKVIGGTGRNIITGLEIDSNNNIYVTGRFGVCQAITPSRIANDTILNNTGSACTLLFMAKFNSNGDMLWFKQPQQLVDTSTAVTYSEAYEMTLTAQNEIHWLLALPPGTYENGAFVNTLQTDQGYSYFVFKYNLNGTFIEAIPIDIQYTGTYGLYQQFYRNPITGDYLFFSKKASAGAGVNDIVTINGQILTQGAFLTCFDSQGQWLWTKENTVNVGGNLNLHDIAFDNQGNMYAGIELMGFSQDSFLGATVPIAAFPAVLIKLSADGTTQWFTHHDRTAMANGAVLYHNGEVIYTTSAFGDLTWGTQTIAMTNAIGGSGFNLLLAYFDATTGQCNSLYKLGGDYGYDDNGTALAIDEAGDLLVGGMFGINLYYGNGNVITSNGGQSDFFIAKFANTACTLGLNDIKSDNKFNIYPNPVNTNQTLHFSHTVSGEIYDLMGRSIQVFSQVNTIEIAGLNTGTYVIKLSTGECKKLMVYE